MEHLECLFCQKSYPVDPFLTFCTQCREPLLFPISSLKKTIYFEKSNSLNKFLDFLPLKHIDPNLCLSHGDTPLIPLNNLMKKFNLPPTFVKNETLNPTGSFKDRGTIVAIHKAVELGLDKIGTVSTGNMASSTAAFGARAGLKTFVLVKEDTSSEKIVSTLVYNPYLIKVRGDYGDLFFKSLDLGRKHQIYFMNSVDPFRIEGYKITGFEIYLEFELNPPQYIVVPVSAGGHITGLMKAFIELQKQGFIQKIPTFIGVQAEGCSPIAQAFIAKKIKVERIKKARTIAHAISNPDPPGGNIVLKLLNEYGGQMIVVNDKEILFAQKLLAESEGLFCQPASATTLAGLLKLKNQHHLSSNDQIVLVITGTGLKSLPSLDAMSSPVHQADLENLETIFSSLIE
ncbi:MAG: threonine synthase [Candidatus Aminicenantes bacterium]|nr:threonine synthase [Candidatus Aminicenantes bacterium]